MLPVLATEIVAVACWPAGSTAPGESGSPLAVTDGAVNETVPVNGSLRGAPSIAPSVLLPASRCRLNDSSPGWPAVTVTWKVPDCPGASVRDPGETDPAVWKSSVA